jgi:hypothetical protein
MTYLTSELLQLAVTFAAGGCMRGMLSRAVPRTPIGRKLRYAKAGLWMALPLLVWVLRQ